MTSPLMARIAEWDPERGYGYLNASGGRLFLHSGDFSERYKKPEVGDVIQFSIGEDKKGRTCAIKARHAYEGGRISVLNCLLLLALMFLPVLASFKLGLSPWLIGGYAVTMAFVTFMLYAFDKTRAREGQSRISEFTLHFFEIIGGWPGAFLAQRRLRHKCTKGKYRFVFWMIILGYQYIAIDYLYDWPISGALLDRVSLTVDSLQK